MADDKRGRDKQARDAERRQRERSLAEELERGDETEPPVETEALGDLDSALDPVSFPATGTQVVGAAGDTEVRASTGIYEVTDLVPYSDAVTFDSPAAVRARVRRPTVAAATKRVLEAGEAHLRDGLGTSQREAYEKTFRELKAIDADDDDEGIDVIADWIVEQIREEGSAPGSRAVRRKAATFCREHGYEIRNDEWLGV